MTPKSESMEAPAAEAKREIKADANRNSKPEAKEDAPTNLTPQIIKCIVEL